MVCSFIVRKELFSLTASNYVTSVLAGVLAGGGRGELGLEFDEGDDDGA